MNGSRLDRGSLPPAAKAVDRWVFDAVSVAQIGPQGELDRLIRASEAGQRPLAHRVLAEASRVALEQQLSEGVDAEALSDVVAQVAAEASSRGLDVDAELLIVVLTGLFGLAPTRSELREVLDSTQDAPDSEDSSLAQARRLLQAEVGQDVLGRHAVLVLATLAPTSRDLRVLLERAWFEIARSEHHDS